MLEYNCKASRINSEPSRLPTNSTEQEGISAVLSINSSSFSASSESIRHGSEKIAMLGTFKWKRIMTPGTTIASDIIQLSQQLLSLLTSESTAATKIFEPTICNSNQHGSFSSTFS
ncbi:hypothetical protein BASA83_007908 [Batrachochytrium salamandrivorans]|nr:hypothetical protein BASA83_007908 [Batrachochytrium salamandrivorans]